MLGGALKLADEWSVPEYATRVFTHNVKRLLLCSTSQTSTCTSHIVNDMYIYIYISTYMFFIDFQFL